MGLFKFMVSKIKDHLSFNAAYSALLMMNNSDIKNIFLKRAVIKIF